ncbi:Bestrophin, RFP-TM, chloride channel domain containing protein [Amanita muscaria]
MVKPSRPKSTETANQNPTLLPSWKPQTDANHTIRLTPERTFVVWTFGRGCVIWRIWLAVLLNTVFASIIAASSINKFINFGIPTIMMTVLGVVIGFVLSYRAMSGYDRYWMGRTAWADVIKNSRTLGRLIWFHVPLLLSPKRPEEVATGHATRSEEELNIVMAEKNMALDLIEGFAVALKHHLRGELGKYYEDLYPLIKPLHNHNHSAPSRRTKRIIKSSAPDPHRVQFISAEHASHEAPATSTSSSTLLISSPMKLKYTDRDPIIPPINSYGSFNAHHAKHGRRLSCGSVQSSSSTSTSSSSSGTSEHQPLLPANLLLRKKSLWAQASADFIPFADLLRFVKLKLGFKKQQQPHTAHATLPTTHEGRNFGHSAPSNMSYTWNEPVHEGATFKHRPRVAGGGENLPLEILRSLSEWLSVLEDRGTVPGTSLGSMMSVITAFEDSLTTLERILTTPLPFVYSVHINTVWIYLFFLPFQLVEEFGYYSILGVAIASFIYLGFLAAGEEIEQPFGYDDNDLDLDLFCQDIIHLDIERLKMSPCLNGYRSTAHGSGSRHEHHREGLFIAGASMNGDVYLPHFHD